MGIAALVAAAGAAVAVAWGAMRLGDAAIVARAAAGDAASPDSREPDLAQAQARVDGRSLFFVPSAPPPPPPPRVAEEDRPAPAPPPPPPPSRYEGPQIVALINDTVWLAGGDQLAPGESAQGVRVIAVDAPWSARVEWGGVEFDVSLFARDSVVYPDGVAYRRAGAASEGEAAMESGGDASPGQPEQSERAAHRADDPDTEGTSR